MGKILRALRRPSTSDKAAAQRMCAWHDEQRRLDKVVTGLRAAAGRGDKRAAKALPAAEAEMHAHYAAS